MLKGKVYRIYPNNEQKEIIAQQIGGCRFVYNKLFNIKQTFYDKFKINISEFELSRHIPILKEIYPWLKDVNSQALIFANGNLFKAYKNFFEGSTKFPKYKSKKDNNQSYQIQQSYKINFDTNEIYIPKVGWVKIKLHRDLFDSQFMEQNLEYTNKYILKQLKNTKFLKTITISKTPTGKYFVSILTDDKKENPQKKYYDESTTIGIDVGLKSFAATSKGDVIENPKYLKKSLKKLKHLNRSISKKVKGSNNRKKAILKLAKLHEKVANQRNDFQHKLSLKLVRENQAIAIETLNITGMMKNHRLAQAVGDAAWFNFVTKIVYKAEWLGKTVFRLDQWEPSSKTCSICGYKKSDLTLKDREWTCPECNTWHDRDRNAAMNIKNFALKNNSRQELPEELGEKLTLVRSVNQEALRYCK